MTHLHERRFLKCPYVRSRDYLRVGLEALANTHEQKTITLRVPFGEGGVGGSLHSDVIATYAQGTDPMHFDQPWKIHWRPAGGGPYPEFDGELTVRYDEDYTTSILELAGDYRPPLGLAGAVFDALAGARIASATANELLRTLGEAMERQYNEEERAKDRIVTRSK